MKRWSPAIMIAVIMTLAVTSWFVPDMLAGLLPVCIVFQALSIRDMKRHPEKYFVAPCEPQVPRKVVSLAAALAGRRRNLGNAWLADVAGDPENGITLDARRRRKLAKGFLISAVRMRLHDMARSLWSPIAWVLSTDWRANAAITSIVGALIICVQARSNLMTVISDAPFFAVVTTALKALVRCLRSWRKIEVKVARTEEHDDTDS